MGERKEQEILKPLFSKHLKPHKLFGFDIETYGENNDFYMGGIFSEEQGYKAFYNKDEFIEEFIKNRVYYGKTYVVATNLGFDFTGLFYNSKYWNEFKIILSSSQFIMASRRDPKTKQKIKFIDTINFVKFGVAKMGELLGLPKLEAPDCLGRLPKNEKERKELEIYNKRDCEVTYYFTKFLQESFNKMGGNLKLTIASTSMDIYRRKYLRHPIKKEKFTLNNEDILKLIYESYYGGRTEVFKRGHIKNKKLYDINSLYPSVMRNAYPNPNTVRYNNIGDIVTIKEFEGVSKVYIESPKNMMYPFLPYRDKVQKKLIFPSGKFRGTYTHVELRKALELGYKIHKIEEQVYYKRIFYPFKEFVIDLYDKRMFYKQQNNPLELSIKLVMNSLYGKMASRHMHDTTFFNKSFMTDEDLEEIHKKMGESIHSDKTDVFMKNEDNGFIIEKKECTSAFVFPILASYTTSFARIKLYEYIEKYGAYYCDTDSIVTDSIIPESDKLGAMKLEYDIKEGVLVKPKMYIFKTPQKDIIKLKGVPKSILDNTLKIKRQLSEEDFVDILNGEIISYDKFAKLKESVRRNLIPNSVHTINKKISLEDTKRLWNDSFNPLYVSISKPLHVNE